MLLIQPDILVSSSAAYSPDLRQMRRDQSRLTMLLGGDA